MGFAQLWTNGSLVSHAAWSSATLRVTRRRARACWFLATCTSLSQLSSPPSLFLLFCFCDGPRSLFFWPPPYLLSTCVTGYCLRNAKARHWWSQSLSLSCSCYLVVGSVASLQVSFCMCLTLCCILQKLINNLLFVISLYGRLMCTNAWINKLIGMWIGSQNKKRFIHPYNTILICILAACCCYSIT